MSDLTINDQLRRLYVDGQARSSRQAFEELKAVNSMQQISRGISALRKVGYLALAPSISEDGFAQYVLAESQKERLEQGQAHVYSAPKVHKNEDRLLKSLEHQFQCAEDTLSEYLHELGDQTLVQLIRLRDAAKTAFDTRRTRAC